MGTWGGSPSPFPLHGQLCCYLKNTTVTGLGLATLLPQSGLSFQEYSSCGPRDCHDRKGLAYAEVTLPETGATVLLIVTHMIASVDRKCIVCVTHNAFVCPFIEGPLSVITIIVLDLVDSKGLCSVWSPDVLQCGEPWSRLDALHLCDLECPLAGG